MSDIRIPALEKDLSKNKELVEKLKSNPQKILKKYGIEVNDAAADKIKGLLKEQIEAGSNPQAIYVAVKV